MLRTLSLIFAALLFSYPCEHAQAQHGHGNHDHGNHQGAYPLVYGASGRPYGPTQSHYQYEKRYGRPWHGDGAHGHGAGIGQVYGGPGLSIHFGFDSGNLYNPYPYYGPQYYGPQYYGPGMYYGPEPYPIYSPLPAIGFHGYIPGVPSYSSSSNYERQQFGPQLLNGPLAPPPSSIAAPGLNQPSLVAPTLVFPPSTPAAQVESLHFMAQGDLQLRSMNFLAAADRFRNAIQAARDLAEPRYRYALTQVGRSQFPEAVDEFKLAFSLNPAWINESPSLDDLFGADNLLGKTQVKQRVADWLLQDSRDPNRLFLLAVLLRMDRDARSQILIETAIKVAGPQQHLIAVLDNNLPASNPEQVVPQPKNGEAINRETNDAENAKQSGQDPKQKPAFPAPVPDLNLPNANEPLPELVLPQENPLENPSPNLQGPILPGVK